MHVVSVFKNSFLRLQAGKYQCYMFQQGSLLMQLLGPSPVVTDPLLGTEVTPGAGQADVLQGATFRHNLLKIKEKYQCLQLSWAATFYEWSAFESKCAPFEFIPYLCNFFFEIL